MSGLNIENNDLTQTFNPLTIGTEIGKYRIIDRIGAGGMGEVYLAEDTRLDRQIALKFLPVNVASNKELVGRFVREAKAAAKLNHPNIVTIFEVGEFGGRPYFAMEYVTGHSLAHLARTERRPIQWVVDVAVQLCQGVSEAHRAGIIHRDIKSANILVDDSGRVRILDFGLAAVSDGEELTRSGSTLGTVSYMSPEQVSGGDIDQRSDLFSLGVVLYELLTGQTPFKRNNDAATLNAIMRDSVPDVKSLRNDTPEILQRAISRMLEKDASRRYQSAENVLTDIRKLLENSGGSSNSGRIVVEESKSIAVLPFMDLSRDKDQDYLCQGIAEEIGAALAKVEGLRVAARISTLSFQEKGENVADIGHRLGVNTLLHGSVRKSGNKLRISVQLINVEDGYQTWSDRYDREMEDIFEIEDDIARSVVKQLKLTLSPREERLMRKVATQSVEAYEAYLKGYQFVHLSGKKRTRHAIEMFKQAIEIDPHFAAAYAATAYAYANLYMYFDPDRKNLEMTEKYSNEALELAPDLVDSHLARAMALTFTKESERATWEYDLALKLDPMSWEAHYQYARHCWMIGEFERAVTLFRRAMELRPEDYQAPCLLSNIYRQLNRSEEEKEATEFALKAARKRLSLNPDEVRALYLGAACLAVLGETDEAMEWADRAKKMEPNDPGVLYNLACVYASLNQVERAMSTLEDAIANGFANKSWLVNDSSLGNLRPLPQYEELLKKL